MTVGIDLPEVATAGVTARAAHRRGGAGQTVAAFAVAAVISAVVVGAIVAGTPHPSDGHGLAAHATTSPITGLISGT